MFSSSPVFRNGLFHFRVILLFFLLVFHPVVRSQAVCIVPTITITASSTLYCYDTSPQFTATVSNGGGTLFYQWKKNGVNVGTNTPAIFIQVAVNDVITCELRTTNSCGNMVTVTSNSVTIQSNPGYNAGPEVTIAATQETICAGTPVTFTATNVSQSIVISYQWLVNGSAVGTNSPVFSSNTLSDGAKVECIMTVPHCDNVGSTKDFSNPIVMKVSPLLRPAISITASATSVCTGSTVTFTASGTGGGSNPGYQWKVNGTNAGSSNATFSINTLRNGDVVSCELTVDPAAQCATGDKAVSNAIEMRVQDAVAPTVQITASQEEICKGSPVTFTASSSNAGTAPTYQWQINGSNAGSNSNQYTTASLSDGDRVSCLLTPANTACATTAHSNTISVKVHPVPVIQFNPTGYVIQPGQQVQLQATVQGDIALHEWTPASLLADPLSLSPFTTPLNTTTTFRLQVQSAAGCTDTASIVVAVNGKLLIPNSFTPNSDGKNDVFRVPPTATFQLKTFSVFDRWGNRVFFTSDINKGWDGKSKGFRLSSDTFVYVITGHDDKGKVFLKGTVQLIR